jgi:hypothetical protein
VAEFRQRQNSAFSVALDFVWPTRVSILVIGRFLAGTYATRARFTKDKIPTRIKQVITKLTPSLFDTYQ